VAATGLSCVFRDLLLPFFLKMMVGNTRQLQELYGYHIVGRRGAGAPAAAGRPSRGLSGRTRTQW
jgi:hypothetical protein